MKKFIYSIIFLLSGFIFILCLTEFVFSINYNSIKGDINYNSVKEKVVVFNYGKNVKKIGYCFTSEDQCNKYLNYDTDLSKRLINVSIDYPDSLEGQRICFNIITDKQNITSCNKKKYIVDSTKPVIKPVYSEIILNSDEKNIEKLFIVNSKTGIKNFSCNYDNYLIKCEAIGNNGLKTTTEKKVTLKEDNPLEGKSVMFVGDSIVAASTTFDKYGGWAARIGIRNQMKWYNAGVGGATITKSKNHILNQIKNNKDDEYDYVILQGGVNDASKNTKLGEMSDSFEVEDFDNNTFAGALEELIYYTKKYNSNSKIGFIITYKTPQNNNAQIKDRSKQVELTIKICEKWNIPYLDLYNGEVYENGKSITYDDLLQVNTGKYFYKESAKDVHLSQKGYDLISNYINAWMKTL